MQVRDEAHRFAVSYHRHLRSRKIRESELDEIPGIGTKRKQALFNAFGDLDAIRRASIDELRDVQGMNEKSARAVWEYFH